MTWTKVSVALVLAVAGLSGACTVADNAPAGRMTAADGGLEPAPEGREVAAPPAQVMQNEGVLCLHATSSTEARAYYFPLGGSCASSSQHRWTDTRFSVQHLPQGETDAIRVDSFTRHTLSDSPVATSDCAGANVQQQTVTLTAAGRNVDVYWGGRRIGQYRNTANAMLCRELRAGVVRPAGAAAYEAVTGLSGR